MRGRGLATCRSGQGQVARCCEHSNKFAGSIQCEDVPEQLSSWWPLKETVPYVLHSLQYCPSCYPARPPDSPSELDTVSACQWGCYNSTTVTVTVTLLVMSMHQLALGTSEYQRMDLSRSNQNCSLAHKPDSCHRNS